MFQSKKFLRLLVALQLTLTLCLILLQLFKGFADQYYQKQQLFNLYHNVMGHQELVDKLDASKRFEEKEKILRHQERFETLDTSLQQKIKTQFQDFLSQNSPPLIYTLALRLFYEPPPLIIGFLILSLVSSFAYIYQWPLSVKAFFFLPLTLLAHLFFSPPLPPVSSFQFPTEQQLIQRYASNRNEVSRENRLLEAWKHYLAEEWAPKKAAGTKLEDIAEEGEYYLQLFRLQNRWRENYYPLRSHNGWYFNSKLLYSLLVATSTLSFLLLRSRAR